MNAQPSDGRRAAVDRNIIRTIAAAACTTPTGDNCQPWRLLWDGQCLHIHHDAERAAHYFNTNNHASLLALGMLIETVAVAAGSLGLEAEPALQPELGAPTGRWASIAFGEAGHPAGPFDLGVLELRATDRRPYLGGTMDHPLLSSLSATGNEGSLRLDLVAPGNQALLKYIARSEQVLWVDRLAHADVHRWLHFNRRPPMDGMSWRTLGVNYLESRLLSFGRRFHRQRLLNRLGFLKISNRRTQSLLKSSAAVGCISIASESIPDSKLLVEAGRLGLRAWLHLNKGGFGFQPLTAGALMVYNLLTEHLPASLDEAFRSHFATGRVVLAEAFGYDAGRTPVWMFRTGISTPLSLQQRSLRLRLEEVVTFAA